MNIRFSGFGGQGVVLSGVILGWAALLDNRNTIQTQSYGSSARGGSCKCDVIIQDSFIYELEPVNLDVLVSFSQPAYNKYKASLKANGTLFIDSDLVLNVDERENIWKIPATDIAFKEIQHKIMANIVMLGYINSKKNLVNPESLEASIKKYVPEKFFALNIEALWKGMNYTG